jgi:hypothetical protein
MCLVATGAMVCANQRSVQITGSMGFAASAVKDTSGKSLLVTGFPRVQDYFPEPIICPVMPFNALHWPGLPSESVVGCTCNNSDMQNIKYR